MAQATAAGRGGVGRVRSETVRSRPYPVASLGIRAPDQADRFRGATRPRPLSPEAEASGLPLRGPDRAPQPLSKAPPSLCRRRPTSAPRPMAWGPAGVHELGDDLRRFTR